MKLIFYFFQIVVQIRAVEMVAAVEEVEAVAEAIHEAGNYYSFNKI